MAGRASAIVLIGGLAGCYTGLADGAAVDTDTSVADGADAGDAGDAGDPDAPPDAPTDSVPATSVPDALDTVPGEGFCVSTAAGQTILGVSPDGYAWLGESVVGGSSTAVRFSVVDPWSGSITAAPSELDLGTMVAVEPRSADDAVVVAADALWHVEGWSRVELVPPQSWSGSASACGNPRDNGYVLAGGTLYEHRPDGWWGLTVQAPEGGAPDRIIGFDGECTGPDDETWTTAPDGTVWRVSVDGAVRGLRFAELQAAAATGSTLAVLADGELWLGPQEWTRFEFEAGAPSTIAASSDQVWIAVGSRVLRAAGGEFTELAATDAGDAEVTSLHAHPGGVWIARGEELCHAAVGAQLRVGDLFPYQRTPERELSFSLVPGSGVTVEATVDDEPVALTPGGSPGERIGVVALDGLGWHRLKLRATGTDDTITERTVWLRHDVPAEVGFAADVAPIAAEHCSGDACHSAMTTAGIPVLETLEAWTDHVDDIEERVVELDNMPPLGVRADTWGSDEVEMIARWIEGGMLP